MIRVILKEGTTWPWDTTGTVDMVFGNLGNVPVRIDRGINNDTSEISPESDANGWSTLDLRQNQEGILQLSLIKNDDKIRFWMLANELSKLAQGDEVEITLGKDDQCISEIKEFLAQCYLVKRLDCEQNFWPRLIGSGKDEALWLPFVELADQVEDDSFETVLPDFKFSLKKKTMDIPTAADIPFQITKSDVNQWHEARELFFLPKSHFNGQAANVTPNPYHPGRRENLSEAHIVFIRMTRGEALASEIMQQRIVQNMIIEPLATAVSSDSDIIGRLVTPEIRQTLLPSLDYPWKDYVKNDGIALVTAVVHKTRQLHIAKNGYVQLFDRAVNPRFSERDPDRTPVGGLVGQAQEKTQLGTTSGRDFDGKARVYEGKDFNFRIVEAATRSLTLVVDFGSFTRRAAMYYLEKVELNAEGTCFDINIGPDLIGSGELGRCEGISTIVYMGEGADVQGLGQPGRKDTYEQNEFLSLGERFQIFSKEGLNYSDKEATGGPLDINRCFFVPSFKSQLFGAQQTIEIPTSNGATSICIYEAFREIMQKVIREAIAKPDFEEAIKSGASGDAEDKPVLGIVFTHPGHVSFDTHRELVAVLHDLAIEANHYLASHNLDITEEPKDHISLVSAMPEPIALAFAGNVRSKIEDDDAPWVVIDFGKRTFDIAVFIQREKGAEGDAKIRLLSCQGADLGGEVFDFAIIEAIAAILVKLSPNREEEINKALPLNDADLRRAFSECLLEPQPRQLYERYQTILTSVERAKHNIKPEDTSLKIALACRNESGQTLTGTSWFDKNFMAELQEHLAGGTSLSLKLENLYEQQSVQRYFAALELFLETTLSQQELQNPKVVLAGRGASNPRVREVLENTLKKCGGTTAIDLTGSQGKDAVCEGAGELSRDFSVLQMNPLENASLVLLRNDRIEDVYALPAEDTLIQAEGGCKLVVLDLPVQLLKGVQERCDVSQDTLSWWWAALFAEEMIGQAIQIPPAAGGAKVTIEASRLPHQEMTGTTIDEKVRTAIADGHSVTGWHVKLDGEDEKSFFFMQPGALFA